MGDGFLWPTFCGGSAELARVRAKLRTTEFSALDYSPDDLAVLVAEIFFEVPHTQLNVVVITRHSRITTLGDHFARQPNAPCSRHSQHQPEPPARTSCPTPPPIGLYDDRVLTLLRMCVSCGGMCMCRASGTRTQQLELDQRLKISRGSVQSFVLSVRARMLDNPYHNWTHVADVTQTVYSLAAASGVLDRLTHKQRLALLLAALCHDLEHPVRRRRTPPRRT